ncbi:hypothetical protein [Streptomyces sp. YGL11-2]|uniref:hypothetical protein n=1 Tax=Streptomyces sp. YGL11-2 TaxID=3414028 RepID=UPI003CEB84C8
MARDTGCTMSSREAGVELERTLDRLEARREVLPYALRARRRAPRFELWRHDLRETRDTGFRFVDLDGQDPTPEGS